ncbi:MAG: amidohydrolase family protein [Actinomycetota bacterium]|nr:amidohydrolase [Actinomycetota bacterium]
MIRWKRSWPDLPEDLPVDVMPASNGEFIPKPATDKQKQVMALQNEAVEHWRRRMGMSRREFVRTAMAYSIGFWAINQVYGNRWGRYAGAHNTNTTAACDLEWTSNDPMLSVNNLPGEFIFDVQSHHVESDGMWRVTNPAFEAFFAGIWAQAGPLTGARPGVRSGGSTTPGSSDFVLRGGGAGELDPIENLSRFHYLKELFLDSATTMTVLSAVPSAPELTQPLPLARAAWTVHEVNRLAGYPQDIGRQGGRTVLHAFVMPNRGSAGTVASFGGKEPVFMQEEFELMETRAQMPTAADYASPETAQHFGDIIRGWKTYPAWGDVPYSTGWFFDDPLVGQSFINKVRDIHQKYPWVPANIATHKGFALPGFDQRAASPRDIGPAASRNPDVNFIVYHSGYDGETMAAYPGDDNVNSADRTVNSLIKSLRENNWDATRFPDGNVPNVYAEIGSTWRSVMGNANAAAHLLAKLIIYVGPKRICWGTDSLWFGSPHSEIIALRAMQFSDEMKALYPQLPHGIDGDMNDPTQLPSDPRFSIRNAIFGRNAAAVYGIDADAHLGDRKAQNSGGHAIACDQVQLLRDEYVLNQMTPKETLPLASNQIIGPRTRRELFTMRRNQPWGP